MLLIKNAKIITMEEEIGQGFILIEKGKIVKVGDIEHLPSTAAKTIDLTGKTVLPGFIDAHSHIGLTEDGVGGEGEDLNEMSSPITPEIRAIDGVNPLDKTFAEAVLGGVTTSIVSPGSANVIAGGISALKSHGISAEAMVITEFSAMKFALGENPKTTYGSRHAAPYSRMAVAALIRQALTEAKIYMEKKENANSSQDMPSYNFKHESLISVLKKQSQAHFHAHRAYDMQTAIRISEEFGLDWVIVHGTEGHLIADYLAEKNARVIAGPIMNSRSKPELQNLTLDTTGELLNKGLKVAVSSDHPEVPAQFLPVTAALLESHGITKQKALETLTTIPADILALSHRVGRLKAGLDADIQVYDGDYLGASTKPSMVFINGVHIK